MLGCQQVGIGETTATAGITYHQGMTIVEVITHDAAGTEEINHASVGLAVDVLWVVGCAIGSVNDVISPRPYLVNDSAELWVELPLIDKAFLNASLVADDEDVLGIVFLNGLLYVWLELPVVDVFRERLATLRHYQRAVKVTEQDFLIEEVSYSFQYLHLPC